MVKLLGWRIASSLMYEYFEEPFCDAANLQGGHLFIPFSGILKLASKLMTQLRGFFMGFLKWQI